MEEPEEEILEEKQERMFKKVFMHDNTIFKK